MWYRIDSLLSLSQEDSIPWTDEYTTYSVVRSINPDSAECLWSISEDDTIASAVLTRGIYTATTGPLFARSSRDFSRWCIYAYHSGIHLDSTKRHTVRLGEQIAYRYDSIGLISDSLHAEIEMEEFAYFTGHVTKLTSSIFQTYLALKYGITLDYAPYLSCEGDTLWNPIADEDYYHRITGIGNDTVHDWYNLSSQSKENASLLLAVDSLGYGEYVLVGDDGGDMTWHMESVDENALQRRWRIRTHTRQAPRIIVMLKLESSPMDVRLIAKSEIDGHTRMYRPDSVCFDSIYYFTLANLDTLTHVYISSIPSDSLQSSPSRQQDSSFDGEGDISYDSRSNTITIAGFPDGQMFDLYLYTGAGQFITTVSSRNPVNVGTLPQMVSYIEIFASGRIVGSITIPVHM